MRFRQAHGRPHEERPVRDRPVSVASILIAVTVKPLEQLPANVHPEDVLAELGGVLGGAAEDWFERRGHVFCVVAPSIT